MARNERESKKEYARILYMQGEMQKTIAEKTGLTPVTINKWVKNGGWEALRAASNITRPELVNKLLRTINNLLDEVNNTKDPTMMVSLGDRLSKFASTIEKLDRKASVVDAIEVFMAFNRWIQHRRTIDPELSPELVRAINKYQDIYVSEQLSK
ncbi:MAG: terminase [Bacteroidetes bacterium]|nr:terminase [Bacteroidota bacterium]